MKQRSYNKHPWHPSYTLYIRRRDHVLSLIEQGTHRRVPCSLIRETSVGMFLRLHEAYGVFLMEDEIQLVDELPIGKGRSDVEVVVQKAEQKTTRTA